MTNDAIRRFVEQALREAGSDAKLLGVNQLAHYPFAWGADLTVGGGPPRTVIVEYASDDEAAAVKDKIKARLAGLA